ncbi:hypothetical protein L4C34_10375 [Vibrio profundum]|uniref:hypothetical protein n=1 Tax=Vibrio profundum TaxID=2910247 RepID=UPI003D14A9DF
MRYYSGSFLLLAILLLSFPQRSYANETPPVLYKLTSSLWWSNPQCGSVGMTVAPDFFIGCGWLTHGGEHDNGTIISTYLSNGGIYGVTAVTQGMLFYISVVNACPSSESYNPDTKACEPLPEFCDRDETVAMMASDKEQCEVSEGIYSAQCVNETETYTPQCVQPNACVIGKAGWPECMADYDPTTPPPIPELNFNPATASTAPKADSYDKQEADTVTETSSTDTAVLEAVQNLNRDANTALTSLDTNLTQGVADINTALNQLNATNNAVGQSVVDQLNQDYQIFQAQKDLQLQTTGAVANAGSRTVAATNLATDAINDNTNELGQKLDALKEAVESEACVPSAENSYCENPHGLDSGTITDIMTQVSEVADGELDNVETTAVDSATAIATTPLTGEVESNITALNDAMLAVLPQVGNCSPLVFEFSGKTMSIDCSVSAQIKTVLSYLFYLYTGLMLMSILFDEVTPKSRKATA